MSWELWSLSCIMIRGCFFSFSYFGGILMDMRHSLMLFSLFFLEYRYR